MKKPVIYPFYAVMPWSNLKSEQHLFDLTVFLIPSGIKTFIQTRTSKSLFIIHRCLLLTSRVRCQQISRQCKKLGLVFLQKILSLLIMIFHNIFKKCHTSLNFKDSVENNILLNFKNCFLNLKKIHTTTLQILYALDLS